MLSAEDPLRIYAAVQAEFGPNPHLAELVCVLAKTLGVEAALLELGRALAHPRVQGDQPAS
jgi:hypothetical protein